MSIKAPAPPEDPVGVLMRTNSSKKALYINDLRTTIKAFVTVLIQQHAFNIILIIVAHYSKSLKTNDNLYFALLISVLKLV